MLFAWLLYGCLLLNEGRSILRSKVSYSVYAAMLSCVHIQQAGLCIVNLRNQLMNVVY